MCCRATIFGSQQLSPHTLVSVTTTRKRVCHKQRSPCVLRLECLPAATRNPAAATRPEQPKTNLAKDKNYQPSYFWQFSFRYERKMKSFPDKQKLKGHATEPAEKCWKELFKLKQEVHRTLIKVINSQNWGHCNLFSNTILDCYL